jgi:hypothetical protein
MRRSVFGTKCLKSCPKLQIVHSAQATAEQKTANGLGHCAVRVWRLVRRQHHLIARSPEDGGWILGVAWTACQILRPRINQAFDF